MDLVAELAEPAHDLVLVEEDIAEDGGLSGETTAERRSW